MQMRTRYTSLLIACCASLWLTAPTMAQTNNDGFQRRNGQMYVVRNGQPRLMTRDAHLPTGAVVTKEGFVVSPQGQRTELREGQGCTLRGQAVEVVQQSATGQLTLATPRPQPTARPVRSIAVAEHDRDVGLALSRLLGERRGKGHWKKGKGHGKGKGHRKKGKKDHEWEEDD